MQQPSLAIQPVVKTAVGYAGFWRRAAAYAIDGILLSTLQATLTIGVLALSPQNYSLSLPADRHAAALTIAWDIIAVAQKFTNVALACSAIGWAYFSILESSPARATIGKAVLGIYVADRFGDPISFARASARYWFKALSSLLLMAGWFMAAFTTRKQAMHDLLAGTLVLRNLTYITVGPGGSTEPGEYWDGRRWVGAVAPDGGQ